MRLLCNLYQQSSVASAAAAAAAFQHHSPSIPNPSKPSSKPLYPQDDDGSDDEAGSSSDGEAPYTDFDLTPLPPSVDAAYRATIAAREADYEALTSAGLGSIAMFRQQVRTGADGVTDWAQKCSSTTCV